MMIGTVAKKMMDTLKKVEHRIQSKKGVIMPSPHSLEAFDFIGRGGAKIPPKGIRDKWRFFTILYPRMMRSIIGNFKSNLSLKYNPEKPKTIATQSFIAEIEEYLTTMGVSKIGYTKLESQYIFEHTAISYENVIVLAMEMQEEKIEKAPSLSTELMVHRVYADLGDIANKLASFLRKKGYGAHSSVALRGTTVFPPLAQKANMGVVGRNGVLLTEEFGPRVRLAAVYTSIENLPFANPKENPHQWIRNFCDTCGRCIRKCPPKALYEEPLIRPGGITYVDNNKCFPYFHKNNGCAICIKECPFSASDFRVFKKAFMNSISQNQ